MNSEEKAFHKGISSGIRLQKVIERMEQESSTLESALKTIKQQRQEITILTYHLFNGSITKAKLLCLDNGYCRHCGGYDCCGEH